MSNDTPQLPAEPQQASSPDDQKPTSKLFGKKKPSVPEPSVSQPPLFSWRVWLHRIGLLCTVLAFLAMCLCWAAPFAVLSVGPGGSQLDPWDVRILVLGLVFSALGSLCALIGRGSSRLLLFMTGAALFVLTFLGFLSNHL